MSARIPRLFHWIWFGDRPLPDEHRRWIDGWLELHPGWDHVLWTDANRPRLVNESQFQEADSPAQRADIARYELVRDHGGVYLDTDVECLRDIDALLEGVGAFSSQLDDGALETSILGATRGHPWLSAVIERLPDAMRSGWSLMHQTGPGLMTSVTKGRADVARFGQDTFVTLRGDQHAREDVVAELRRSDAYCIHHAVWSWRDVGAAKYDARLRLLVREDIEPVVPPGALFVLVDKGSGVEVSQGRRFLPFPERDGVWNGYPADDAQAIAELERLIGQGASFLVVPAPMAYWLDTYPGWHARLCERGRRVADNERAVVFTLS